MGAETLPSATFAVYRQEIHDLRHEATSAAVPRLAGAYDCRWLFFPCMIRVLIVDDFEVVRRGLKEIFADEFLELEVGEAGTSQAALELVMKQEWELVLLDINIPGRNGLEVLEEVRRLRPRTPVLVLSAYPEEEFAIRSFKLGASGYLNKSLASDEILAATEKILAG